MKKEINFLLHYKKKIEKIKTGDRKPFQTTIVFLLVCVSVLAAMFFVKDYFQKRLNEVMIAQENYKAKIEKKQKEEEEYLIFFAKISMIADILIKRYDGMEKVVFVNDIKSETLKIRNIDYDFYDRLISITVETENIFTLEDLFNRFDEEKVKMNFAKIKKESLVRMSDGKYSLIMKFYLKDFKE